MSVHIRLGGIRNMKDCETFIVTVWDNLRSHAKSEGHCMLRYCLKIGQEASPINYLKQHFITQLSQTCGLHSIWRNCSYQLYVHIDCIYFYGLFMFLELWIIIITVDVTVESLTDQACITPRPFHPSVLFTDTGVGSCYLTLQHKNKML